jgi:hypothetical protein
LETASRLLEQLGVSLNLRKTRIVHVRQGFEFLGFSVLQKHADKEFIMNE